MLKHVHVYSIWSFFNSMPYIWQFLETFKNNFNKGFSKSCKYWYQYNSFYQTASEELNFFISTNDLFMFAFSYCKNLYTDVSCNSYSSLLCWYCQFIVEICMLAFRFILALCIVGLLSHWYIINCLSIKTCDDVIYSQRCQNH